MPTRNIPSRAVPTSSHELHGVDRSRIIGVAIDPAKTFHKVLIFDFAAQILEGPFDIDALRSGWDRLLVSIRQAKRLRRAKCIVIGLEASGAYSWHLSRELSNAFEHVYLFNPLAVATARKQKLLLGQKTDAIDVAVIGDLLLRGQGYPLRKAEEVYIELRERTFWRHHKAHLVGKLKQQIADRFEKVYPGLTVRANGSPPFIGDTSRSRLVEALIEEQLLPQEILRLTPQGLRRRLVSYIGVHGKPAPARLQGFLRGILYGPESLAHSQLVLLKRDLVLLQTLAHEIAEVEREMVDLLQQTPGRWLVGQIRGLSEVQVASYIGALGDPRWFSSAKQIYSLAGLSPRQHQSGTSTWQGKGITKCGRQILRTILFKLVRSVALHEPVFRDYRRRLQQDRKKHFRTAQLATANKLNRTLFALMRDQQPFRRGDTVSRIGPRALNG